MPIEDLDRDIDDEIAFHVAMRARDNAARGMDSEAARAEAERRFGDVEKVRRNLAREGRSWQRSVLLQQIIHDLASDFRLALRSLRRRPVFSAVTALTLALGIGASTAVYSLANAFLFRPVPGVRDPGPLVTVSIGMEEVPEAEFVFSHAVYAELRHGAPALAGLAASQSIDANIWLQGTATPRRASIEYVSDDYADVLGLHARAGRVLVATDARNPNVAMISDRLWTTLFAGNRSAVGATLSINGASFTIVGVAPRGFRGAGLLGNADLWVPVEAHAAVLRIAGPDVLGSNGYPIWMELVGRLAPGRTAAQASAQLETVVRRLRADASYQLSPSATARVREGIGLSPRDRAQLASVLGILGGAVLLLLVLACANASNLLLARTGARRAELEIRRAIGAGRARVVRLLLAEAAVIVVIAAITGVAMARIGLRLFAGARLLTFMPPSGAIALDRRVLAFTIAATVATGIIFGIVPATTGSGRHPTTMHTGRRSVSAAGPVNALVVLQVALSAVLLVGSTLLLRTMQALGKADLGFDPRGVLEASFDPAAQGYDEARSAGLFLDLLAAVQASPDVSSAGLSRTALLSQGQSSDRIRPQAATADDASTIDAWTNQVSPGFLSAAGFDLVAGRDFRDDEWLAAEPRVAILSVSAARRLFGSGPVLGQHVDVGGRQARTLEVIGVVRDARIATMRERGGFFLLEPMGHVRSRGRATLYVRSRTGSLPPVDAIHRRMSAIDPALPFYDVQAVTRRVAAAVATERVLARLTSVFATLSLALAAIGLYGLMAMLVQGRMREIGLRLALGARPASVRRLVLARGMRLTGIGLAIGLLSSTQAVKILTSRLWGVRQLDALAFVLSAVVLTLTALAACWVPGRRATRVHPVDVLSAD